MIGREASSACRSIDLNWSGEPVRISICHRLECQKRTGSAFTAQARFLRENIQFLSGDPKMYARKGDSGAKVEHRVCGSCGSAVWYVIDNDRERIPVALDAFANPSFPPPRFSVYEERRHAWIKFREISPVGHSSGS